MSAFDLNGDGARVAPARRHASRRRSGSRAGSWVATLSQRGSRNRDGVTRFAAEPRGMWTTVITLEDELLLIRADGSTVAARTPSARAIEPTLAPLACAVLGLRCPPVCGCSWG